MIYRLRGGYDVPMDERDPILVTAGVVIREGRVLVARRKAGSHLGGLWEFPGGKLEPGESPEECLARELREELGISVRVGRVLETVYHRYPEKNVLLLFYACQITGGEPQALDAANVAWVRRAELSDLEWVPADVTFVERLASEEK
jgi:8-oxo-dGTP diphosphatase